MARNLIELFYHYDFFKKKVVAYVKDEGENLNAMTRALKLWWIVKFLVWRRVSKVLALVTHFLKHVDMG